MVTIPVPVKWNWWEIDACLRGPDHASGESTVRDMLGLPRTPRGRRGARDGLDSEMPRFLANYRLAGAI
ncbi:MAG: hypothetical protein ACYDB6_12020, partial [Candidatus Limnocylindrales bacterium]